MPLTDPIEEIVHGTIVRDPYRWLEDRNLPETEEWIRVQQRRCGNYFAPCPELSALERRVRAYLDIDIIDQPAYLAGRCFYRKRPAGWEQASIYMREVSREDERILVDPSRDGKYASVGIYRISPDGALLAYEVRRGGEDRKEIRLVDVNTGTVLPECIPLGYGRGFAFSSKGYFYCHETDPTFDEHTIYYQSFGRAAPGRAVFCAPRTRESRLILTANAHCLGALCLRPDGSEVLADFWLADLVDETPDWVEIFRNRRAPYTPILCHDRLLILVETESNGSQLIELSRNGVEVGVIVPERETPIRQIAITRDRIFVSYLNRGVASIDAWLLNGRRADSVNHPKGGTIQILPAYAQDTDSFFYTFESFDVPSAIYRHHAATNASVLWHQRGPTDRKGRTFVHEATIRSKDGAKVQLTLVSARRDGAFTRPRPVIMTSYGGFGVTMTPQFSVLAAIMLELGAVFALPHIRGGGEFGRAWHDAGRARNRQAAFDDFIAAAEWLCNQAITTPLQLGIFGGSNSGLLVGAMMTQRPDLFGAVLCIAPLLDMVRYESFDQAVKWRREYGTVEDPEDFQALHAYSPYHHVAEDVDYPATLFVSGDKDDRCNPAHTRKMAALLQERPAQKSPIIVDYSTERGHSPVLPLSDRVSALARRIAFLCRELHIAFAERGA
jgi:prolyl oligopeptidase